MADSGQTALQKHVAFFDRNKDGVVYPWETFQAIGAGILQSTFAAVITNVGLSGMTRPGNIFPNFLFPIEIKNIKLGIHGSDSGVYDADGRFVPLKFEEIFLKYARTTSDALTADELGNFIKGNRDPLDFVGWIAALGEWKLVYSFGKEENGLLKKDTIRGVYDGSLFEKLAEKKINSSKKKLHM